MTHDPFCTQAEVNYDPLRPCYCDVIDKVRADTVEQIWLAHKERQRSVDIPDIPGHESGCPWAVKKVCVCDSLYETRREAFNDGWKDGYEEGFDEGFTQGKRYGRP